MSRTPQERIAELRVKHPKVSPEYFDLLLERELIKDACDRYRQGLIYLTAYFSRQGAVPVAELQKLLDENTKG